MSNASTRSYHACVLRDFGKGLQYVPIDKAANVRPDERAFVGSWQCDEVRTGPHKSHTVTICTGIGTMEETTACAFLRNCKSPRDPLANACVLRDFMDGNGKQYTPARTAAWLDNDEPAFVGDWDRYQVRKGPSGSHLVTLCAPIGKLKETTIGALLTDGCCAF